MPRFIAKENPNIRNIGGKNMVGLSLWKKSCLGIDLVCCPSQLQMLYVVCEIGSFLLFFCRIFLHLNIFARYFCGKNLVDVLPSQWEVWQPPLAHTTRPSSFTKQKGDISEFGGKDILNQQKLPPLY